MYGKKVIPLVYILLVYLSVATSLQHIYNVTYFSKYYIGIGITIGCFFIYVFRKNYCFPLERKMLYLAWLLVIPMLSGYVYSVILDLITGRRILKSFSNFFEL